MAAEIAQRVGSLAGLRAAWASAATREREMDAVVGARFRPAVMRFADGTALVGRRAWMHQLHAYHDAANPHLLRWGETLWSDAYGVLLSPTVLRELPRPPNLEVMRRVVDAMWHSFYQLPQELVANGVFEDDERRIVFTEWNEGDLPDVENTEFELLGTMFPHLEAAILDPIRDELGHIYNDLGGDVDTPTWTYQKLFERLEMRPHLVRRRELYDVIAERARNAREARQHAPILTTLEGAPTLVVDLWQGLEMHTTYASYPQRRHLPAYTGEVRMGLREYATLTLAAAPRPLTLPCVDPETGAGLRDRLRLAHRVGRAIRATFDDVPHAPTLDALAEADDVVFLTWCFRGDVVTTHTDKHANALPLLAQIVPWAETPLRRFAQELEAAREPAAIYSMQVRRERRARTYARARDILVAATVAEELLYARLPRDLLDTVHAYL